MIDDNGPNDIIGDGIIGMNNAVSGAYNGFCVGDGDFWLQFKNSAHRLSNDFDTALDRKAELPIGLIVFEAHWLSFEKGLNALDGGKDI